VAEQIKCLTYLALFHRKSHQPEGVEQYASRSLVAAKEAQNATYTGWALANLAWVNWYRGDLAQAEQQARAALELWPPGQAAGLWALWPLLGIALVREQIESAVECAEGILGPDQWQMPRDLTTVLEAALEAFQSAEIEAARTFFQQASALARLGGYL
jgi:hypothetical protein